jgi:hypothetical protein
MTAGLRQSVLAASASLACAFAAWGGNARAATYSTGLPHIDQGYLFAASPDRPWFQRPSAGNPPTTLAPGDPVQYAEQVFVAPRAGTYQLSMLTLAGGALYTYRDRFDPAEPLARIRRGVELRSYDVHHDSVPLEAGERLPLVFAHAASPPMAARLELRLDAPAMVVPGNQTTRFTINVPDNFQVGAVNGLTVWTDVLRLSGLTVSLVHDGVRVTLLDDPNISIDQGEEPSMPLGPAFVYRDQLRFADGGLDPLQFGNWSDLGYYQSIGSQIGPTGTLSPQNPTDNRLSDFAGMSSAGDWTLEFTYAPDYEGGSITGFQLDLSPIPEPSMLTIVGLTPLLLTRRRVSRPSRRVAQRPPTS